MMRFRNMLLGSLLAVSMLFVSVGSAWAKPALGYREARRILVNLPPLEKLRFRLWVDPQFRHDYGQFMLVLSRPSGDCHAGGGMALSGDPSLPSRYIVLRESGGDYCAQNRTSSASGAFQFINSTWNNYKGYPTARSAPPWVQDEKAREVWAGGAGISHWRATAG